jgi:hypothetical protein
MHAFTSLILLTYLAQRFLQKVRVHVQQSVYRESCKYAYFGTQNSRAVIENNSEHYMS